jgi:hypothetical protein
VNNRINPHIKAHVIRGAFYVLLLLAGCVIPFALAQRSTEMQSPVGSTTELHLTSSYSDRDAGALPTHESPTDGVLWSQYNNPATEPPLGIGSQEFEPAMALFNDQAADDFILSPLPPNNFYYLTGVRVMGEYSQGGGPASSFNVYIYGNAPGHLPGGLIAAILNRP